MPLGRRFVRVAVLAAFGASISIVGVGGWAASQSLSCPGAVSIAPSGANAMTATCASPAPTATPSPTATPTPALSPLPTATPSAAATPTTSTPAPLGTPMLVRGIVGDTLTIPPANPTVSGHFFNYCNTPATFAPNFGCTPLFWLPGITVIGTPKIGSTFVAIGYGRPPAFYASSITFTP